MSDRLVFDRTGVEGEGTTAMQFARSLSTIKDFPRYSEAIQATAEDLMDWCTGAIIDGRVWGAEAQAYWLTTEARRKWLEWKGTAALESLFREKFKPNAKVLPGNAARELGPKPEPDCSTCKDIGWVETAKGFAYCACEQGSLQQAELGERWLRMLNGARYPGASVEAKRHGRGPIYIQPEEDFREYQERTVELIAKQQEILADENATREQKEIAREVLRTYGVEEGKKK
jgi:hypothetical protein